MIYLYCFKHDSNVNKNLMRYQKYLHVCYKMNDTIHTPDTVHQKLNNDKYVVINAGIKFGLILGNIYIF